MLNREVIIFYGFFQPCFKSDQVSNVLKRNSVSILLFSFLLKFDLIFSIILL